MPSNLIANVTYEQNAELDDVYPNIDETGSIAFSDFDGSVLGPIPIAGLRVKVLDVDAFPPKWKTHQSTYDLQLYVTEARVVFHDPLPGNPKVTVGHLRYSSFSGLSFSIKRGFLSDNMLLLNYNDAMKGIEFQEIMALGLTFDKKLDVTGLAQEIARRLARHMLLRTDVPAETHARYNVLADADRLPAPIKDELADYPLPACKAWPTGLDYITGQEASGQWELIATS